jgi:hypothetical protein
LTLIAANGAVNLVRAFAAIKDISARRAMVDIAEIYFA